MSSMESLEQFFKISDVLRPFYFKIAPGLLHSMRIGYRLCVFQEGFQ